MSKAAKIAITIGLMVVWALLRSLLEYSDFPLPVLTVVFILIILGLWAFGKTPKAPEAERPHERVESEKPHEVSKPELTDRDEKVTPSIPRQVKSVVHVQKTAEAAVSEMTLKLSMLKDIPYEQQLLESLRKACFPRNFMEPYDPDKVSIANELYNNLQAQDLSQEDIYSIRDRAIKELGITIDASFLFEELSTVCNPTKYMDPYDAIKVRIANELYRKVMENKEDIFELEKIRKDAIEKGLLAEKQSVVEKEAKPVSKRGYKSAITYILVGLSLLFLATTISILLRDQQHDYVYLLYYHPLGSDRVKVKGDIIEAPNDSIAYLIAYEKFCNSKYGAIDNSAIPDRFILRDPNDKEVVPVADSILSGIEKRVLSTHKPIPTNNSSK